jgi:GGDEF domain-containing protein
MARKILRALARPFVLGGNKASITASIGISVFPIGGNNVETLLKRADDAMYEVKAGRGNDYRFSGNPSLYPNAVEDSTVTDRSRSRKRRRTRDR